MMNILEENEKLKTLDKKSVDELSMVERFLYDLDRKEEGSEPLDIDSTKIQELTTPAQVAEFAHGYGYEFPPQVWIEETHELKKLMEIRDAEDRPINEHPRGFLRTCTTADYIFSALNEFNADSFD
ncbi:MAG: hypothetical protein AAFZ17_22100 [Cyanobacteria bacterium J06650_10]